MTTNVKDFFWGEFGYFPKEDEQWAVDFAQNFAKQLCEAEIAKLTDEVAFYKRLCEAKDKIIENYQKQDNEMV